MVELTADWVTVITPLAGPISEPLVVFANEIVAESLSPMVLVATRLAAAPREAAPDVTAVRVMTTVSLPSTIRSFSTGMLINAVVLPEAIVTVPESAVKSAPDVAVPATL